MINQIYLVHEVVIALTFKVLAATLSSLRFRLILIDENVNKEPKLAKDLPSHVKLYQVLATENITNSILKI